MVQFSLEIDLAHSHNVSYRGFSCVDIWRVMSLIQFSRSRTIPKNR